MSPGRRPRTTPVFETSATSVSRTRRSQNAVTSASEPSANRATTASRPVAPGRSSRDSAGRISIARAAGRAGSRRAPSAIQARMTWYSHDPGANRRPPSCGTCPVALSRTRLRSGSRTFTRRPPARARSPGSPGRGRGRRGSGSARPAPGTTRGSSRRCTRAGRTGWRRGGRNRPAGSADPSGSRTGSTPPPHDGRAPSIARSPTAAATTRLIGPLPWVPSAPARRSPPRSSPRGGRASGSPPRSRRPRPRRSPPCRAAY